MANHDPLLLGYCCGPCYKNAQGLGCNYWHGWRCERESGAHLPEHDRCLPCSPVPGGYFFSMLTTADPVWFEDGKAGRKEIPNFDWLRTLHGAGGLPLLSDHTTSSLLCQLLLFSPPLGEAPDEWARRLHKVLSKEILGGAFARPSYGSGEAPSPWGLLEGAFVPADSLLALAIMLRAR